MTVYCVPGFGTGIGQQVRGDSASLGGSEGVGQF